MTHSVLIQSVCNEMFSQAHISHPFQKKLCLPTYISRQFDNSCHFGHAASHTLFPFQTIPYVMISVYFCVSIRFPLHNQTLYEPKNIKGSTGHDCIYVMMHTIQIFVCIIWQSSVYLEIFAFNLSSKMNSTRTNGSLSSGWSSRFFMVVSCVLAVLNELIYFYSYYIHLHLRVIFNKHSSQIPSNKNT